MGLLVTHLAALVPEQVPPGVPTRGAPLPDETGWVARSGPLGHASARRSTRADTSAA